jgi:hypothetical protein
MYFRSQVVEAEGLNDVEDRIRLKMKWKRMLLKKIKLKKVDDLKKVDGLKKMDGLKKKDGLKKVDVAQEGR